jgi:hypothetical protein
MRLRCCRSKAGTAWVAPFGCGHPSPSSSRTAQTGLDSQPENLQKKYRVGQQQDKHWDAPLDDEQDRSQSSRTAGAKIDRPLRTEC